MPTYLLTTNHGLYTLGSVADPYNPLPDEGYALYTFSGVQYRSQKALYGIAFITSTLEIPASSNSAASLAFFPASRVKATSATTAAAATPTAAATDDAKRASKADASGADRSARR